MNRYEVKIRGHTLKLYYPNEKAARAENPEADEITLISGEPHMKYVNMIKDRGTKICSKKMAMTTEMYSIELPIGRLEVALLIDDDDGTYLDLCSSREVGVFGKLSESILKDIITPEELCNTYLSLQDVTYETLSVTKAGAGEKLNRPSELKGIKQSGSIVFIPNKCTCQYFIKDNDIYIKHNDYFSPTLREAEDIGTPLTYRLKKYGIKPSAKDKFIYPDTWGDIVLRVKAWIKISNVIPLLRTYSPQAVSHLITDKLREYENIDGELDWFWNNFFLELCKEISKNMKEV